MSDPGKVKVIIFHPPEGNMATQTYEVSSAQLPVFIEVLEGIIAQYPKTISLSKLADDVTTWIWIQVGAEQPYQPHETAPPAPTFEQLYRRQKVQPEVVP